MGVILLTNKVGLLSSQVSRTIDRDYGNILVVVRVDDLQAAVVAARHTHPLNHWLSNWSHMEGNINDYTYNFTVTFYLVPCLMIMANTLQYLYRYSVLISDESKTYFW